MTKIDELVKEFSNYPYDIFDEEAQQYVYKDIFVKILTSLQEPTEKVVEMKEKGENKMTFTTVFNCSCCGGRIYGGSTTKYCHGCGGKIKRVD